MAAWNLADLLQGVTDLVADRTAVIEPGKRLTFGELDERANRAAHVLRELGVDAGDHVGVALHNCHEYLEVFFGACKVGAVPVNVNWRYTVAELRYLFADANLTAVVHPPELTGVVARASSDIACQPVALAVDDSYQRRLDAAPPDRPAIARSGDDRYLLYTGGTTGMPKGVVWRHEDLIRGALDGFGVSEGVPSADPDAFVRRAIGNRVRMLPVGPLTHGTAQWTTLMTVLTGGTVVLLPSIGFDPAAVWDAVEREQVSYLVIVGDASGRPLAEALVDSPHRWELSDLIVILSGGATLSVAVRDTLLQQLPSVAVVDGYGTSETGGQGQMAVFAGQRESSLLRFNADDHTAVLDDDLQPVPRGSGIVGRIARRGNLPLGYHNDPERTAQTFPTVDGVRWAIPGDLATIDADGRIVLLGRIDRVINTGGEKVFAEEVEAVLRDHPAVADAVVVGVPDERWGERIAALVVLRNGADAATADLVAHCRRQLAGFKVPRRMKVVARVPRLVTGKPDHRWARLAATR